MALASAPSLDTHAPLSIIHAAWSPRPVKREKPHFLRRGAVKTQQDSPSPCHPSFPSRVMFQKAFSTAVQEQACRTEWRGAERASRSGPTGARKACPGPRGPVHSSGEQHPHSRREWGAPKRTLLFALLMGQTVQPQTTARGSGKDQRNVPGQEEECAGDRCGCREHRPPPLR